MDYCLTEANNNKTIENTSSFRTNKAKRFLYNSIFQNDPKWGEKLRDYEKSKEIFHYDQKYSLDI